MKHPSVIDKKDVELIENIFDKKDIVNLDGEVVKTPKKPKKKKKPVSELLPIDNLKVFIKLTEIETVKDLMRFEPGPDGIKVPQKFWRLWRLHKEEIKRAFFLKKIDGVFLLFKRAQRLKKKEPEKTIDNFFK